MDVALVLLILVVVLGLVFGVVNGFHVRVLAAHERFERAAEAGFFLVDLIIFAEVFYFNVQHCAWLNSLCSTAVQSERHDLGRAGRGGEIDCRWLFDLSPHGCQRDSTHLASTPAIP